MSYIAGNDRSQVMLLPESVEQYIDAEHPVRAIDAFVEGLAAEPLGFTKARPAATGRPPYDPLDLLRLFLWGYLNRVRSSRRLELECGRNLELLWLLRGLRPDFKTLCDFRRDNAEALKAVFREFVLLCRELKLFGQELVAIDGTKLKASNHPARRAGAEQVSAWMAELDGRIAEYLAAMEKTDTESDLLGESVPAPVPGGLAAKLAELRRRKDHLGRVLAAAQQSGEKAPLTDPECQSMSKVGLGYNAQIAVDAKHHLIAVAELAAQPTDHVQLPVVAAVASAVLEAPQLKVVADAGYHDQQALATAEESGLECYVPRPAKGHAAKHDIFPKADFSYEPARDGYRCPAGRLLPRSGHGYQRHGLTVQGYVDAAACRACPLQMQCTHGKYRRIERWEKESLMEAIAERVADHPELIQKRKALVEHPFGTIKFWWGQGAVLARGRRSVQAELSLSAWAYNFRRVLTVLGAAGFRKALRKRQEAVRAAASALARPLRCRPSLRRRRLKNARLRFGRDRTEQRRSSAF